jgi:hypothetical protein
MFCLWQRILTVYCLALSTFVVPPLSRHSFWHWRFRNRSKCRANMS